MWTRIGRFLFISPIVLLAGELNFVASVNKTEIGHGEPLVLSVSVEGENIGSVPGPQLPELPDFNIAGRSSSQSTNIQFINGKVTQQQTINYIYTLYSKKTGTFTIGPCVLEFKGETYKTQPIEIKVVQGTAQPSPPSSTSPTPSEPGVAIDENLKLVGSANQKSVFQGEQIVVEFSLYNRLKLSDLRLEEMPTFNGFWVEPIFDAKTVNFQRKSVQGKSYNVCLLKKSALFPVTAGKLKVGSMKINVAVVRPPRDFFDFFGTTQAVRIESDPIYINVKPLPSEGKPEEFTGGVGQFSIEASLDRTQSEAAEPINLTVRIGGTGNIKLIEKPFVPSIPGVKILDPEIKDNVDIVNYRVMGYKEFNYPLIPQTDGEHLIPHIRIAFFNPKDKKYHTIETEQLKFTATQTAAATEAVQASGIKVLGSDIHYIKPDATHLSSQTFYIGGWLILFYLGTIVMIGVSLLYRRHQARMLTDRAYARKLRSRRLARKRLKEAEQHLKKGNDNEFHTSLSRVLLGYIGDRYDLDTGALTKDDLVTVLKKKGIKKDTITKLEDLLNQCDIVRFSPGMECKNPTELFEKTKEVLNEL